jgi:hypothetical protein
MMTYWETVLFLLTTVGGVILLMGYISLFMLLLLGPGLEGPSWWQRVIGWSMVALLAAGFIFGLPALFVAH